MEEYKRRTCIVVQQLDNDAKQDHFCVTESFKATEKPGGRENKRSFEWNDLNRREKVPKQQASPEKMQQRFCALHHSRPNDLDGDERKGKLESYRSIRSGLDTSNRRGWRDGRPGWELSALDDDDGEQVDTPPHN
ncbi:hypothetical protein DAPPUDRAFT_233011 [Daphnia pulex]|uniref:Uncharacterized protein n=1 Tax=Daphnia pulex TaxID=6669 RepID=E9FSY3_DAPPU|nr:hypothetical protein DAPPUDRAFT_233011 [Daphnia pulex]|eukprot:EFX89270.1 hypothetical protein DAPPUDRAFT_233011 [Daphnia pulex]